MQTMRLEGTYTWTKDREYEFIWSANLQLRYLYYIVAHGSSKENISAESWIVPWCEHLEGMVRLIKKKTQSWVLSNNKHSDVWKLLPRAHVFGGNRQHRTQLERRPGLPRKQRNLSDSCRYIRSPLSELLLLEETKRCLLIVVPV